MLFWEDFHRTRTCILLEAESKGATVKTLRAHVHQISKGNHIVHVGGKRLGKYASKQKAKDAAEEAIRSAAL